jgi:hypothetical protein
LCVALVLDMAFYDLRWWARDCGPRNLSESRVSEGEPQRGGIPHLAADVRFP